MGSMDEGGLEVPLTGSGSEVPFCVGSSTSLQLSQGFGLGSQDLSFVGVPVLAGRAWQPCGEAAYHLMLRPELAVSAPR